MSSILSDDSKIYDGYDIVSVVAKQHERLRGDPRLRSQVLDVGYKKAIHRGPSSSRMSELVEPKSDMQYFLLNSVTLVILSKTAMFPYI